MGWTVGSMACDGNGGLDILDPKGLTIMPEYVISVETARGMFNVSSSGWAKHAPLGEIYNRSSMGGWISASTGLKPYGSYVEQAIEVAYKTAKIKLDNQRNLR